MTGERVEESSKPKPGATGGRPAEPEGEAGEGKARGERPYVFRFLPADPKNALEFEDMADK